MSTTSSPQTIHFSYSSIGNIVRLIATIQFENTKSGRDITVFHNRFDREPDELFETFITKILPEGGNIGKDEIEAVTEYIYSFMQKDDKCKDLYVKYDKRHYNSYVYFKPDKDLRYAEVGRHYGIVKDICIDYFKGFDEVDIDYLKKFIRENFEILSDFTTIQNIVNDADSICNEIGWRNARERRRTTNGLE